MASPIPPLPPELAAALAPSETAAAYLARAAADPIATGLFFAPALRPGDALDVVGPSGAGKTELLVQAAADALLAPAHGGRGERVLYIDCDGTLDVDRVAAALAARAAARGADAGAAAAAADDGLARLTIVTCYSSFDLLATLTTLRPLLDGRVGAGAGGGAPPPPCRLLLLDNAAAFYWADRAAGVAASLAVRAIKSDGDGGPTTTTGRALTLAPVAAAAAARLRAALRGHKAAAIIATHAVLPGRPGEEPPDPLPPAWKSVASRRVALAAAGDGAPAPRRGGVTLAVTPRDGRGRALLCESGGGGVWPVEA